MFSEVLRFIRFIMKYNCCSLGADHGLIRNHEPCDFESYVYTDENDQNIHDLSNDELPLKRRYKPGFARFRNYRLSECVVQHVEEHLRYMHG